jgi:hypothetical protein
MLYPGRQLPDQPKLATHSGYHHEKAQHDKSHVRRLHGIERWWFFNI